MQIAPGALIGGRVYNHELAEQVRQQGEPLTAGENLALYALVRIGDTAARKRMVTGNLPLVVEWVNNFIHDGRMWLEYLRDDLTSAGFLGLVGAVNNLAERVEIVENPIGYLRAAVVARLFSAIEQNQNVKRPQSGGRARRDENWTLPCTVFADLEKLPVSSEIRVVDLRDFIGACCQNDTERQYVQLKEDGNSCTAVGQLVHPDIPLKTSAKRVERVIHRIETQVQQKWFE